MPREQRAAPIMLSLLPVLFIPIAVLTYITGFLVSSAFMERYGLKDSGAEFLKVKYLNTGIMFLVFPIVLLTPIFAFLYLRRLQRLSQVLSTSAADASQDGANVDTAHVNAATINTVQSISGAVRVYTPTVLLVTNLLLVFYILALFAPFGYVSYQHRAELLFTFFASALLGSIFVQVIQQKLAKTAFQEKAALALRYSLLVVTLMLTPKILEGLTDALGEVASLGTFYFVGFIALMAYIAARIYWRVEQSDNFGRNFSLIAMAASIMAALYYLAILTFALAIFPYIPAAKGGGDYTDTRMVVIRIYARYKDAVPPELYQVTDRDPMCLKPLILF